jgi:hypothetical protein
METAPVIEQIEFGESDFPIAEQVAKRLGYKQTAYTSTSGLWGLFCLPENPQYSKGPHTGGCIIKTKQFGFMFVADLEDLHMDDLRERQVEA